MTSRHSTYTRKLSTLPFTGTLVKVNLCVYKYYCRNKRCKRKIFTERLGKASRSYARSTASLTKYLNRIGSVLGGNAGSSLACFIGISVSSSTLIRVLHKTPPPSIESPTVIGINDWAFCQGKTYGTIIVDLEKRKPIDLLPDREVETVINWLCLHPSIQIVSRDRGSSYIQGVTDGAPQAIQVADRWQLLENIGEAQKRITKNFIWRHRNSKNRKGKAYTIRRQISGSVA